MTLQEALRTRWATAELWRTCKLPYDHVQVPDKQIQALFDSAIRNIWQAREIKNGLPAFQVGAAFYRGLWIVDGASFSKPPRCSAPATRPAQASTTR